MRTTADHVLRHLLRAEPAELDQVPDGDPNKLIQDRRLTEHHHCLRCPSPARVAYIANCWPAGRRWVDLCPWCNRWFVLEHARLYAWAEAL